jgi:hypothetical protein
MHLANVCAAFESSGLTARIEAKLLETMLNS